MRWLRGWTDSKTVELELLDLVHYNKLTESQGKHVHGVPTTDDHKSLFAKFAELKDPSVYKPMKLMMIYFFVSYVVSIFPVRPYITKMLADVDLSHNMNVFMVRNTTFTVIKCPTLISVKRSIHFSGHFIKSGNSGMHYIFDDRSCSGEKVLDPIDVSD